MANVTISDLTGKTAVATDELEVQATAAGASNKVTALSLMAVASPTLTTPALGVATATSINKVAITAPATSATLTIPDGLTLNAGPGGTLTALAFTAPGTGVATALAINVGSAGAPVVLNGAGGTPSSLTGTNITGTAAGLTAGTVTTNANLTGDVTSSGNATTLATVNSDVGSFTNSSITVNAKGLITAASSGAAGATLGANTFTALQTITQASANAGIIASTGYSLTGSDATGMVNLAGTWNTSGNPVAMQIAMTNTASGSTTKFASFLAGASGTTEVFSVDKGGTVKSGMTSAESGTLSFAVAAENSGIGRNGSVGGLVIYAGGAAQATINANDWHFRAATLLGWDAIASTHGTRDLFIGRGAAATLQQGAANAASPVAQTLQAQGSRSGTDTNVGGGNYTMRSGTGTGTGTLSSLILQSPIAVASGTGAQTNTTGLTIHNGTAVLVSYTVAALPAAPMTGAVAMITDQLTAAAAKGVAPTGGGAVVCVVVYTGAGWVGI